MSSHDLAGKRALITGGMGFIGSALTRRLTSLGAKVRVLDSLLPQRGGTPGSLAGLEGQVEIVVEDTRSRDSVYGAIRDCDIVFHLADHAEYASARTDIVGAIDTACLGTLNVLDAVRVHAPKARLVFASSHLVYGDTNGTPTAESAPENPTTLFGVHKLTGEKYCGAYAASYGVDARIARLATVFGPGQRLAGAPSDSVPYLIDCVLSEEEVTLYGDRVLDLLFIDDAIEALLLLAAAKKATGPVNVASGTGVSLGEIANQLIAVAGRGKVRQAEAPRSARGDIGSVPKFVADVTKLRALGAKPPLALRDALARTIEWYREGAVLERLQRSSFLRPRERLYELLLLQHADRANGGSVGADVEGVFDRRTLAGAVASLVSRGLLTEEDRLIRLTAAGRQRLHYLLVDYVRELDRLNESAQDILRRSMMHLALAGVRRVAFYPYGETAEVAFKVLPSLGFELVGVVDDSATTWGMRFHHLRVRPPEALREIRPDAVIVTTAVFQETILARVKALETEPMRVHVL